MDGTTYVSLYLRVPFYGGPEEGGCWGEDVVLESYCEFPCTRLARGAMNGIKEEVEKMNSEAKRRYGEYCLSSMEWLDERGLDASYLPEVNGEESYFCVIERQVGSHACRGERVYS